jgi:lysozyme family protein
MIHVLISKVIDREGGFVNHPADRGGPTNMGVTQATLASYRGKQVTVEDVRNLGREEVEKIFYEKYWVGSGFVGLNRSVIIEEMLLDAAVHHGPVGAAKLLQLAVGALPDGKIGPETRKAVDAVQSPRLAAAFIAERVAKLGRIITNDSSQAVFAAGWMNRMKGFIKIGPMA